MPYEAIGPLTARSAARDSEPRFGPVVSDVHPEIERSIDVALASARVDQRHASPAAPLQDRSRARATSRLVRHLVDPDGSCG